MTEEKKKKQLPIADYVMDRVALLEKSQGFVLPKGYNASNALNKAMIYLQTTQSSVKGVDGTMLETSDSKSVSQALFDMVIQGLSPNQTQVYFIQRHDYKANTIVLNLQRSYFGTQMVLKRLPEIKDIKAFVVYEGDELETGFDLGSMQDKVVKFEHSWKNQDKPIQAVLAVIYKTDGSHEITVMTKKQIDQSWSHAQTNRVQKEFPDEMAKRTVINRAAKNIINTSTGNQDLLSAISNSTETEYDNDSNERKDVTPKKDISNYLGDTAPEPPEPEKSETPKDNAPEAKDDRIEDVDDSDMDDFLDKYDKGESKHSDKHEAEKDDQQKSSPAGTETEQASLFDSLNDAKVKSK